MEIKHKPLANEENIPAYQRLEMKLKILQNKLVNLENEPEICFSEKKVTNIKNDNNLLSSKKFYQEVFNKIPQENITKNTLSNLSSTKQKEKRPKSAVIANSETVTQKNSKIITPQKHKKVILSHVQLNQKSSKLHEDQEIIYTNRTCSNKKSTIKNNSDHKTNNKSNSRFESLHDSEKKKTFGIEDQLNSENKLAPRHLSSYKKSDSSSNKEKANKLNYSSSEMKKIKKKRSVSKSKKNGSILTEEFISQDDPKKVLLKLAAHTKRKNLNFNILDHHIVSYSREPLIPLKEKINLERELKSYSKENLKLKAEINQLKKYEQEYSKMKELFEKFEKQMLNHRNLKNNKF